MTPVLSVFANKTLRIVQGFRGCISLTCSIVSLERLSFRNLNLVAERALNAEFSAIREVGCLERSYWQ